MAVDPAELIVSLVALGGFITGLRQRKKSGKREDRIQGARQELNRRELQRKEALDANVVKDRLIETLQRQHDRDEVEKQQMRDRCDRELERERAAREAENKVCRAEVRHMHEELMSLASILTTEAHETEARLAAQRGEAHLRFEHGETDDPTS